jgi:imidazole glycerol-phosphate synthase subunit HisH
MITAIIDYGSGNLRSAAKAFERAAREADIATDIAVTGDASTVRAADRVVLPGVGAFADCRRGLAAVPGMEAALTETVIDRGRPFLGICVGMQLMAERGREFETVAGLGWIKGEVSAIVPGDPKLKIPHMGWNQLRVVQPAPCLRDLPPDAAVYFVHSYCVRPTDRRIIATETDYPTPFTSAIWHENVFATQFHPEKSQSVGLTMLRNFAAL